MINLFKEIDQGKNQFYSKSNIGLGLTASKRIVTQYQGFLNFTSKYRYGTTFNFGMEVRRMKDPLKQKSDFTTIEFREDKQYVEPKQFLEKKPTPQSTTIKDSTDVPRTARKIDQAGKFG